jgi:acyl carrier protein
MLVRPVTVLQFWRKAEQGFVVKIRDIVYDQVKIVANQHKKKLPPIMEYESVPSSADNFVILETGLDSLCVAILIASLDDKLNVSPFDEDNVRVPKTYGDLISIYESAS